MENFESAPKKVKEKSVYLLHLDTPRIIILTSAIIGLVVIAFLFGMNILKQGDSTDSQITQNSNMLLDEGRSFDHAQKNFPEKDDSAKGIEEKLPDFDSKLDSKAPLKSKIDESGDKIVSDFKEPVPVIKDPERTDPKKKKNNKKSKAESEKVAKKSKKNEKDRSVEKDTKKSKDKVVEVADKKDIERSGFSIQVASFDKKSKAQAEINSLKEMKYDSFIDDAKVDGKHYFRVRIGPISTKEKALKVLNELQEISRYESSFLVKE